jgi:hypothetical protein
VQLIKGREKPHKDKCKEIKNDWNYDACCTLKSLLVSGLENLKGLTFVAESVHTSGISGWHYSRWCQQCDRPQWKQKFSVVDALKALGESRGECSNLN